MTDFLELKRQALERHLKRSIAGEVRFDLPTRRLYSTDASIYMIEPVAVVIPRTVEDIRVTVQIAAEHQVSIIPRGGGTSLSGQSIGAGIVVDCSKYLHEILEINPSDRTVRVQPGVVLDQLNRALAAHGMQFGPEVSTASRANLGGMMGNNSAGSRSIIYGKTLDSVRRVKVVLADGSPVGFGPLAEHSWEFKAAGKTREANVYRRVQQLVHENAAEIQKRFPKIIRRVSGYNLDALQSQFLNQTGGNLASLIVGSEGTLAFITEAELKIIPRPKYRGLLVPHFTSLAAAMDSVATCLESLPSAIELMDQMLLDLGRENLNFQRQMRAVQGRPAALFMVEFVSDSPGEVEDRLDKLESKLQRFSGVSHTVKLTDPAARAELWSLREAGMPLLYGIPGDRKPVTFIEDCAVPVERLPEFVKEFRAILGRNGTEGAFYGHASVGCLHIRPMLNLKDRDDVARMRCITEAVSDLVLHFGGSLSGEHGDGLARSEWNRKMFGAQIYQAFRQVKQAFDPNNLFNPGKIVDAPAMTENLRYPAGYRAEEPVTLFDYSKQEGFARSIEMCNGSGACRRMEVGTMCPSFRATRDEKDSTRGRANALRLAITSDEPLEALRSEWMFDTLDLCLQCKACKSECPSNVDMAKLKSEFLHQYYQVHKRPPGQRSMTKLHQFFRLGSAIAPVANWIATRRLTRLFMEKFGGIARWRSLPTLHFDHFRRWFRRHQPDWMAGKVGTVILLDDCFTTYTEPEIGIAAVRVLERAGYAVELAGLTCCCRPMISKGFLPDARKLIIEQAARLAERLTPGVHLVGLEPSCLLTLTDEWPELVGTPETRRIAAAAELADGWLARQVECRACSLSLTPQPGACVVHGHCHQKALVGTGGTTAALKLVPDLDVQVLDTGCCGMAGSFGYENEHYRLSVQIAKQSLLPQLDTHPDARVVASGTSCRHQIRDLRNRRGWHPLEVLAKGL